MRAIMQLLVVARNFIVGLSFISGFCLGAIFGETVVNKTPTALTFFLAGEKPIVAAPVDG